MLVLLLALYILFIILLGFIGIIFLNMHDVFKTKFPDDIKTLKLIQELGEGVLVIFALTAIVLIIYGCTHIKLTFV